jgi:hypothetical protein
MLTEAVGSVTALRSRTFRFDPVSRMGWRMNFVAALVRVVAMLNQLGLVRLARSPSVMRSPSHGGASERQCGTQEYDQHPLCD